MILNIINRKEIQDAQKNFMHCDCFFGNGDGQ
jgi:hypothetical protein